MPEIKESVAESERRLAQHVYVDGTGNPVESIESAVGNTYRSKSGFERTWTKADFSPEAWDMLASFGCRTLMINTTSGARQRDENEQEALDSRHAQLVANQWRERGEGVARGPKYDKAILAQAVYDTATAEGKTKADSLGGVAYIQTKLDDKSYYAKVRARNVIMARYLELAGSADEDSDSLIG